MRPVVLALAALLGASDAAANPVKVRDFDDIVSAESALQSIDNELGNLLDPTSPTNSITNYAADPAHNACVLKLRLKLWFVHSTQMTQESVALLATSMTLHKDQIVVAQDVRRHSYHLTDFILPEVIADTHAILSDCKRYPDIGEVGPRLLAQYEKSRDAAQKIAVRLRRVPYAGP